MNLARYSRNDESYCISVLLKYTTADLPACLKRSKRFEESSSRTLVCMVL